MFPQHFSSIQNQFEESKTNSIFKNDSIFQEGEVSLNLNKRPKSDRDDRMDCDLDEIELNQLQKMCLKFLPMASSLLRDTAD